jgi:hypothetical protein
MTDNLKNKKLIRIALSTIVFIIVFLGIVDLLKPNSFSLEINVVPADSSISIDEIHKGVGNTKIKLKRGLYTVRAEKEGYIPESKQLVLDKNTTIEIRLTPVFEKVIDTGESPLTDIPSLESPVINSADVILGINKDGNLVQITNKSPITLYQGIVKSYENKDDTVLILDENNLDKILVMNIKDKSLKTINLPELSPIISATLSDDKQKIFFLAEFNIDRKTPVLYSLPVSGGKPEKLTETRALSVEYWTNDIVVLFEEAHDFDKNKIHLFDVRSKKNLLSLSTGFYSISPDKSKVFAHSKNYVRIINSGKLEIKETATPSFVESVWKDNNTLVLLENTNDGIDYALLNTTNMTISNFSTLIKGTFVQNIYGVIGESIFIRDYKDRVIALDIR